jgi:ABC-type polysaccharide/polyol phosphate transport system ATPase subunit
VSATLLTRELPSFADPSTDIAIRTRALSKAYKIYDTPFSFLKEAVTGRPHHQDKHAVTDISLEIRRGEIVGVIGRNGAGKSTLLKLIAGTLSATGGSLLVNGRVSAILELGTGFNPAYSGRDNVIMSALMRGMSEAEVLRKLDSIVAFAGLEDVVDQPFQTYSSGMQARLAFAAAISVEADILIIDEALSTGDVRFAARSLRRVHEICQSGVTALFVSHVTYHVMQLCTRVIWIDDGRVRMDGPPIEVVRAYEYDMQEAIARDQGRLVDTSQGDERLDLSEPGHVAPEIAAVELQESDHSLGPSPQMGFGTSPHSPHHELELKATAPLGVEPAVTSSTETIAELQENNVSLVASLAPSLAVEASSKPRTFATDQYRILDVEFLDRQWQRAEAFRFGEVLRMRVRYECLLAKLPEYSCGLAVAFNRMSDFEAVMYFNTNYPHSDDELRRYFDADFRRYIGRRGFLEATIDPVQLRAGEYYVSFGILPNQPSIHEFYEYSHCQHRIRILANGFDEPSVFYPAVSWRNGPDELLETVLHK